MNHFIQRHPKNYLNSAFVMSTRQETKENNIIETNNYSLKHVDNGSCLFKGLY